MDVPVRGSAGWGAMCALLVACGGTPSGGDDDGGGVFDGSAAAADAGAGQGDSAVIFDESAVRTYEIEVAPADWQWLNDNARAEQYVPATLTFEGETITDVAIRYKGGFGSLFFCFDASGNLNCDKLSIKLKFSEYDPNKRFYGLKRLNFHSMNADPTKMHDAIGYRLFRDAGIPAPRSAYAQLIVNGQLLGLYAVVEQIDGRFTRSRFPDGGQGNLYKEVWPVHTTQQPYLDALRTNEDQLPSADKMVRFAQALSDAGDAGFEAVLDSWMDLDQLMTYYAVARLIDHWDGTIGWYCVGECFNHNYYWYESTTEDRVWLIAWDLDHTFEEPSPIRTNYGMPDWDDVGASCDPIPVFFGIPGRAPACDDFTRRVVTQLWDRYRTQSQALLAGAFSQQAMNARIDELEALLASAVADDPDLTPAGWSAAVDELRLTVAAKRAHVSSKF